VSLTGLSGHADYRELMKWAESITEPPQRVFVTHGEPQPAAAMADRLQTQRGFPASVPSLGEEVEL